MALGLFEVALRDKYRYPYNGSISTEDLFDLSMPNLDKVYRSLSSEKKKRENASLMSKPSNDDVVLDNKISIVTQVFEYKKSVAERAEKAVKTREANQKILEIINRKQYAELEGKSIEELQSMIQSDDE